MTEPFLLVDGIPGTGGRFRRPYAGGWSIAADLDGARVPSGPVEVRLAGMTMRGTVDPDRTGTFGERRRVRVVGGLGWRSQVDRRHHRNDGPSGVSRRLVLESLAGDIGETVVVQDQAEARLGAEFTRPAGPAGDALRLAIGPWSWWVDLDGVTHVGTRTVVDAGAHEVLDFDPGRGVAKVAVDELGAVAPGARLRSPLLEAPFVVHDVTAEVSGGTFVLTCSGAYEAAAGVPRMERFLRVLRAFVRAFTRRYDFHGVYRYRVVSQAGDRVTLQAVARRPLPDVRSITLAPGMPGMRAELQLGGFVLVSFVDGDPAQPVVVGFWRVGEPTWRPATLELDAVGDIKVGAGAAPAPREGDTVQIVGTVTPGTGTVSGVLTILSGTAETPAATSRVKL